MKEKKSVKAIRDEKFDSVEINSSYHRFFFSFAIVMQKKTICIKNGLLSLETFSFVLRSKARFFVSVLIITH
jgi:hypothetical protein